MVCCGKDGLPFTVGPSISLHIEIPSSVLFSLGGISVRIMFRVYYIDARLTVSIPSPEVRSSTILISFPPSKSLLQQQT